MILTKSQKNILKIYLHNPVYTIYESAEKFLLEALHIGLTENQIQSLRNKINNSVYGSNFEKVVEWVEENL